MASVVSVPITSPLQSVELYSSTLIPSFPLSVSSWIPFLLLSIHTLSPSVYLESATTAFVNPKSKLWLFAPSNGISVERIVISALSPLTTPSLSFKSLLFPSPLSTKVKTLSPKEACFLSPIILGTLTIQLLIPATRAVTLYLWLDVVVSLGLFENI